VIAQEEIFGPVLSVIPADGITKANDTIYGLNASVSRTTSTGPMPSRGGCGRERWGTTVSAPTRRSPSVA
jgi:hypothetical protein